MATKRESALRKLDALALNVDEHLAKCSSATTSATAQELETFLGAVFDDFQPRNRRGHSRRKQQFVFHMLDFKQDLARLTKLYRRPGNFDRESASQIVAAFLYHVVPHVRAAGHLLLGEIPDSFEWNRQQP
jgi:hypothetical protein